ncbi:MAG: hypothetical protein ACLFVU_14375 [Phycisphaerae bacterium]
MKSNLNTTIAMLAASAVVLLALVIVTNRPEPAYGNDTVRRGEYIMTTARVDVNDDLLFIMDIESQQINVYGADDTRRSIRLLTTVNLRRLFSVD